MKPKEIIARVDRGERVEFQVKFCRISVYKRDGHYVIDFPPYTVKTEMRDVAHNIIDELLYGGDDG